MDITFQAVGAQSAGTNSVNVAWPAHVAGDLGLMVIETGGEGTTLAVPAGWTAVTGSPVTAVATTAGSKLQVWYKFATSGAEAQVATGDSGDHQVARIITFRGVNQTTPFDVTPVTATKTTASTTVTWDSITTVTPAATIVLIATRPDDTTSVTSFNTPTNSALAELFERGEAGSNAGHGGGFVIVTGIKPTPGATGTTTANITTAAGAALSVTNAEMIIALRPRLELEQTTFHRKNFILNSTMQGAVSGSPGTFPTGWGSGNNSSGLVWSVVGTGTESGLSYIDLRLSGTASAATEAYVFYDSGNAVPAWNGQTWVSSLYARVVGGTTANLVQLRQRLISRVAGSGEGTYSVSGTNFLTAAVNAASLAQNRNSFSSTIADTSTRFAWNPLILQHNAGAVDITLRIAGIQLELGSTATDYIPTSGTAVEAGAPNVFYAATVASVGGAQNLTPNLYSNSNTLYSPTATAGLVTLTPARYNNAQTFYSATAAAGTVTLTAARYDNIQTFFGATVAVSAVALQPTRYDNAQTFYSPTVAAGAVALTAARYDNSSALFAPTVAAGAVTLQPARYDNSQTFYSPTVARGTVTLQPGLYSNANTLYAPTITVGAVTLQPARYDNSNTLYAPTVIRTAVLTGNSSRTDHTSTTGSVSSQHTLTGNSVRQDTTATAGSVSSEHTVTGSSVRQDTTTATGAVSQTHVTAGNNSRTDHTSTDGSVGQTHLLAGNSVAQATTATTGSVSSQHTVAGNSVAQPTTSTDGAVSTEHVLAGSNSRVDHTSTTGSVSQTHLLAGNNARHNTTATSESISSANGVLGNSVRQDNTSTTGAVTSEHTVAGNSVAQQATSTAGAVVQVHLVAGNSVAQQNTATTGAVSAQHVLSANSVRQDNTSTAGAVTQTHLVRSAVKNYVRNSTIQGVVAGSPGTLPTNWNIANLGGLTRQIVGSGVSNGLDYVDIRFSGTTSTTQLNIRFDVAQAVTANSGQAWTHSVWSAVVGGNTANILQLAVYGNIYGAGPTYLSSLTFAGSNLSTTSTLTRTSGTGTISVANAAYIQPQITLLFNAGVAIDITLRIAGPQLEVGSAATTFEPTPAQSVQAITSTAGAVVQVQSVTGNSVAQPNTATTGAVDTQHVLSANSVRQDNTATTGSVAQTHLLSGESVAQATTATNGAVTSEHTLAGNSVAQAATATTGAVEQTHLLLGNSVAQPNTTTSGSTKDSVDVTGSDARQDNTTTVGAVIQTHALAGNSVAQPSAATAAAVSQTHRVRAFARNEIPNTTMIGAASSTTGTGTLPSLVGGGAWGNVNAAANGLSYRVVDFSRSAESSYIDIRIFGTPTLTQTARINFNGAANFIRTSPGETWTLRFKVALVGGSVANVGVTARAVWRSGIGTLAGTGIVGSNLSPSLSSAPIYGQVTGAPSAADAARVDPEIGFAVTNGLPVDITVRLSEIQLERGSVATAFEATPTSSDQATASTDGAVSQTHLLSGNSVAQATVSTSGQIAIGVLGASADQPNTSTVGAVVQTHVLAGSNARQNSASTAGAVVQTHAIAGNSVAQPNTSTTGAVTPVAVVQGNSARQNNTSTTGAVVQVHVLQAAPVAVDNIAQASSIVQTHLIRGDYVAPGYVEQGYVLSSSVKQPITVTSGRIFSYTLAPGAYGASATIRETVAPAGAEVGVYAVPVETRISLVPAQGHRASVSPNGIAVSVGSGNTRAVV